MATLYTEQSKNVRKTWLLMALVFGLIIALGYILGQVYDDQAILPIAIVLSLLLNLGSYWFSDKIALSMARARQITDKSQAPELWNIVENLSITAGLPMPRLYITPDAAPNAFATGRDKNHAAVAVTAGLLQILDRSELEGVVAHELSHIGNRDILLSTIVVTLVGSVALLAGIFRNTAIFGGNRRNSRDGEAGGIMFLIGIVLSILSPIAATLIQLAISRKREFLADASGSLLTRYPDGLASALRKISAYGRPMATANNATAHLYIANPFGPKAGSGLARLFMTHPPVEERIAALMDGKE